MRLVSPVLLATLLLAAGSLCAGTLEDTQTATPPTGGWPEVWGDVGLRGYFGGDRVAPNGVEFDPYFMSDVELNLGLLPRKKLYLFLDTDFWAQRAAPGVTNKDLGKYDFSKRELDVQAGFAYNVIDRFELRASGYSMSSLNRGTSRTVASGEQAGAEVEGRYYFGHTNPYDVGRLSFVGLGYSSSARAIGGDGREFDAGLFAQAYVTYTIAPLRAYLYGGVKLIANSDVDLRLVRVDAGIAVRPFDRLRNVEFRIGDEYEDDVDASISHNLVYGAVRGYFGGGTSVTNKSSSAPIYERAQSAEVWGDLGLSLYATGDRMAPNGVAFDPLLMSDFNLNFGILPRKKLYLFLENSFWVQRASEAGRGNADPANHDIDAREYDFVGGFAWNFWNRFELRGSAYANNNLNRGGAANKEVSERLPSGYQDGALGELRYYFSSDEIYDTARQKFLALGYFPSQSMIGGSGLGFHPGLFARAYGSFDIPHLRSFIYGDARFIAERTATAKLIIFDAGWAVRPFSRFDNLEFRIGNELTADVQDDTTRNLPYGAIRINFSTR